jgi:hypothetical protein
MLNRQIFGVDHVNIDGTHKHIRQVSVAGDLADELELLGSSIVLAEIGQKVRFYMIGNASGEETDVIAIPCEVCGKRVIVAHPANPLDGTLDDLPPCNEDPYPHHFGPWIR